MTPVLVEFLKKWLERDGAYEHAGEWFIDAVARLASLPGFYPTLLVLSGMLVGVWFDALLRRFDGSRNAKLVDLGNDLRRLGREIRERQNVLRNSWPDNVDDLKSELLSCHVRLTKAGIWSPGLAFHASPEGALWLANYLARNRRNAADRASLCRGQAKRAGGEADLGSADRINGRPGVLVGVNQKQLQIYQLFQCRLANLPKSLKLLALPRGIEPLFQP